MTDEPRVHLARPTTDEPFCGDAATSEVVVPFGEAADPDGRHFDCIACLQALRHGRDDRAGET